jgi:hypothetical protein
MTRMMLLAFSLFAMTAFLGCGPSETPDIARTRISLFQYTNWGEYPAGEICWKSTPEGASIDLFNRDRGFHHTLTPLQPCRTLQLGLWEIVPGNLSPNSETPPKDTEPSNTSAYLGIPPKGIVEIKDGLLVRLELRYNKAAEAEAEPFFEPVVYETENRDFPVGKLNVTTDISGPDIEIRDRSQTMVIRAKANASFILSPDGYTIKYLKAMDVSKEPPSTVTVQVKDGKETNAPLAVYQ